MSRTLECPDCGQEVIAIRTIADGKPCVDIHFLMRDCNHTIAGVLFDSDKSRDDFFKLMTYEEAAQIYTEAKIAEFGGSLSLVDLLGGSRDKR